MQPPYVGDRRDDLRSDADSAYRVVGSLLGVHHDKGRCVGTQPSALPRDRLLPDGVGDAAPSAVGARAPGA